MPIYALGDIAPDLPVDGRYYVAPDAHLIGRVRLGQDANVWFGSTLRGDNEWITLGARVNVQENCILHTDMGYPMDIADDVTVGHAAILHGCSIGAGSLIGMGSVILNGARIGRGCLVGANALITENKEFPDFSLIVGSPARVTRQLDEAAQQRLLLSAAHYVANSQRFKASLRRLDV